MSEGIDKDVLAKAEAMFAQVRADFDAFREEWRAYAAERDADRGDPGMRLAERRRKNAERGRRCRANMAPAGARDRKCLVYFIRCTTTGKIKIGSSVNPWSRLATMRTGSATTLELVATEPGGYQREVALHDLFKAARTNGEWFEPSKELLGYLGRVATEVAPPPPPVPSPSPSAPTLSSPFIPLPLRKAGVGPKNPDLAALRSHFEAAFMSLNGEDYYWLGAKDAEGGNRILAAAGSLDDAKRLVDAGFQLVRKEKFWSQNVNLAFFASRVNALKGPVVKGATGNLRVDNEKLRLEPTGRKML